jgi:membrane fusion protein, macrolide-specific efflux system
MRKGFTLRILVFFLLLAVALFVAYGAYQRRPAGTWVTIGRGSIEEAVYGLAKVKSTRVYEGKLGINGTIRRLRVQEGDSVAAGDPLVEFEGASPLRSPFQGVVTRLPFHEQENVFPQVTVVRVEDIKDLYLEVALEQQGALRVAKGQGVTLTFESLRGSRFNGRVETIYPSEDQFLVRVRPDGRLPEQVLPGMTADLVIQVGRKENVLLVPSAGVADGKVIVERGGRRRKLSLTLGVANGEWGEVLTGDLREGERVLVRTEKKP